MKAFVRFSIGATLVVGLAGCGLRLTHATPDELGALPDEIRQRLVRYEDTRLGVASAWQLAQREAEIAAAEVDAVDAKRGAARRLAGWARADVEAARMRLAAEREAALNYCRQRFLALDELHEAELRRAEADEAAAKARAREQRRAYELAVAEQERARTGAVTDRPGVLKEDREKIMARWSAAVDKAKGKADAALVQRRQLEVRADDVDKALRGQQAAFQGRFAQGCAVDWQLPAIPDRESAIDARVRIERSGSPLAADDGLAAAPEEASAPTPERIDVPRSRPLPPRLNAFPDAPTRATPLTEAVESPLLAE